MPGQLEALLVFLQPAKLFQKPNLIKLWKVVEAGALFLFLLKLLNMEVIARFAV